MKPTLKKYKQSGYRAFTLNFGFCYVGKQLKPLTHYQIGCEFFSLIPMYFNLKRKPWIKDLYLLNALLAIPFVLFLIVKAIFAFIVLFGVGLYYLTVGPYLELKNNMDARHLIVPFMVMQMAVIVNVIYLIFR